MNSSNSGSVGKRKVFLLAAVALCLVAALAWCWHAARKHEQGGSGEAAVAPYTATTAKRPVAKRVAAALRAPDGADISTNRRPAAGGANLVDDAEMEKIVGALNAMLDEDVAEGIIAEARRLMAHRNPEVRERAAYAFHWVGLQALPDLTRMLDDPDPEVEDTVQTYWRDTLGQVENEVDRADMLDAAAEVYGDNISLDFLDDLIMEMSMVDDVVALPRLIDMLKRVNDKARVDKLVEAIDLLVMADDDITTKGAAIAQGVRRQAELEAEQAEEMAEGGGQKEPPGRPTFNLRPRK